MTRASAKRLGEAGTVGNVSAVDARSPSTSEDDGEPTASSGELAASSLEPVLSSVEPVASSGEADAATEETDASELTPLYA